MVRALRSECEAVLSVGVYMLLAIVCSCIFAKELRLRIVGVSTTGTITSVQSSLVAAARSGGQHTVYTPIVEYSTDSSTAARTCKPASSTRNNAFYRVGDTVELLYDPTQQKPCELVRINRRSMILSGLGILFCSFAILILLHALRCNQHPQVLEEPILPKRPEQTYVREWLPDPAANNLVENPIGASASRELPKRQQASSELV